MNSQGHHVLIECSIEKSVFIIHYGEEISEGVGRNFDESSISSFLVAFHGLKEFQLLVIIFAYGMRCGAKFTFLQMAMWLSQHLLITSQFLSQ